MENPGVKKQRMQEIGQNAYKTSVKSEGVARPTKMSNKDKTSIRSGIIALAAAALVVGSVGWFGSCISSYNDERAISDYFAEEGYYDAIDDCFWQKNGEKGFQFGYNQSDLAYWASQSDNPDLALYSIYSRISQNVTWNMDEVIRRMGNFGETDESYASFSDYLCKRGFVDRKGNISSKMYEEVMDERVLAEITIKQIAQSNGVQK